MRHRQSTGTTLRQSSKALSRANKVFTQHFLFASCLFAALLFSSCVENRKLKQAQSAKTDSVAPQSNASTTTTATTSNLTSMANANMSGNMSVSREQQVQESESPRGDAESYSHLEENPFLAVARAPLSTFAVDVDTASYTNTRRFLNENQLPPKDAVRIEEFINYFSYDYPQPVGTAPFSVTTEVSSCPWDTSHRLVHIGLQGKRIAQENLPPSNLVFLIDVSGSMMEPDKLPLVKSSLAMLAERMTARDHVAIVVYAGQSGLVLPSTPGDRKGEIIGALARLEAGGSTNGGEGIMLAYKIAQDSFIKGGINRVILATDGDFNVGVTGEDDLSRLIEEKRKSGVFLSVLGFGTGNVKDSTMEKLADCGNGNYAYVDTLNEARKVFGQEIGGTLYTIAKDVKIQVEFNSQLAAAYRLIGYENRLLADRDFNDDKKDAGDIGAGHTVTALYEVVPYGQKYTNSGVGELKYQKPAQNSSTMTNSKELLTVKLRYKEPQANASKLLNIGVVDGGEQLGKASDNLKFSSVVAAFGMLLKDSKYKGDVNYNQVLQLAKASTGADLQGYRTEFVHLVERARNLSVQHSARK